MGHYYIDNLDVEILKLGDEEHKHLIKVLRKQVGDRVQVTDGKGGIAEAEIVSIQKQESTLQLLNRQYEVGKRDFRLHIGVAPTKNSNRIEWMVEKCVEVGIEKISLIITERSERKHVDLPRLQRLSIAALKQSSGTYLPVIEVVPLKEFFNALPSPNPDMLRMIAWCEDRSVTPHIAKLLSGNHSDMVLLIGPEGDFTAQEVEMAKGHHFQTIQLGNKILRTETAAVYGCCAVSLFKNQ